MTGGEGPTTEWVGGSWGLRSFIEDEHLGQGSGPKTLNWGFLVRLGDKGPLL